MSDKIKELALKRDAVMDEMYKAMFVKQNAETDYRKKTEIFNEMDKKLKQALKEEAENDATKH